MITRIIIADDHLKFRQGLRVLLEKEPDMKVVAEAEGGGETISLIRQFNAHVVVMDFKLSNLNGFETIEQILTEFPQIKVVVLSLYSDRRFVTNMLRIGARGYVLKDYAFDELAPAIRLVMSGQICMSPEIAAMVDACDSDEPVCSHFMGSTIPSLETDDETHLGPRV